MTKQQAVIQHAEQFVKQILANDFSGHDWWHIERVRRSAITIAEQEGADRFICELSALLHDVADEKLCGDEAKGIEQVRSWLFEQQVSEHVTHAVIEIISTMSFKGGARPPMRTLEGQVVQDADRLDAIGAVGISRVFAYSGAKGRPIYDPDVAPRTTMTEQEYRSGNDTAINHFHEKLLKLKTLMNTEYGKRMAEERHRYMEQFLERFHLEWEGKA